MAPAGVLARGLSGMIMGVVLFAIVALLGGAQNLLFWNHSVPADLSDWGVLFLAIFAGLYGIYLGVSGRIWGE